VTPAGKLCYRQRVAMAKMEIPAYRPSWKRQARPGADSVSVASIIPKFVPPGKNASNYFRRCAVTDPC
ncbi:MAG: hypothetical protein O2795_20545, partial [Acidobacteria bacterium]|nr:hypothetical protein [Acidobacteriota bacterium]